MPVCRSKLPPTCDDDAMPESAMTDEEFKKRLNRLRVSLLLVWLSVTFCVAYFARDLSVVIFDWPLGFWMAAQGSVLVFLAIVWTYALTVNHWEKQTLAAHAQTTLEE